MQDKVPGNEFILRKFGNYLILDHLVDGGMAQVYRAKYLNKSVNKVIALKMIKSNFLENEEFVKMFTNEAEVSFKLIHSNIAQTYDVGIVDKDLYIAMEYVNGQTLRGYIKKLHEAGSCAFPVDISCYIISQVCRGLGYAHNFTDMLTGEKNVIIHRDITPANIMVSYDGEVKIIDFGIAKAETKTTETAVGVVKGSLSYIGPEYIEGGIVDCRYDIFVSGITFWELVCGRKLFDGDNNIVVLKKILDCNIPAPSSINPGVPPELDEIILKALARDPANRYADMDEFNRKITKFLSQHYPDFNSNDVANFAHDVFKEDIAKDKEKIMALMKVDVSHYINDSKSDTKDFSELRKNEQKKQASGTGTGQRKMVGTADRIGAKAALSTEQIKGVSSRLLQALEKVSQENRKSGLARLQEKKQLLYKLKEALPVIMSAFVLVAVVGLGVFFLDDIKDVVSRSGKSSTNAKTLDRGMVKTAPGFFSKLKFWQTNAGWEGEIKGLVTVLNLETNDRILFDGMDIEYKGGGFHVPLNKNIVIKVYRQGKRAHEDKVRLTDTDTKLLYVIPEMEGVAFGKLVNSDKHPEGAILTIYDVEGMTKEEALPLKEPLALPEGLYKGKVEHKAFRYEKSLDIVIKADKITKIP
jgi:serine/threonine-protein kinase